MEKILETKSIHNGYVSLVNTGKTFKTVVHCNVFDHSIDRNHRGYEAALKRFAKWDHSEPRPVTEARAKKEAESALRRAERNRLRKAAA
jgi:hypothetical protein